MRSRRFVPVVVLVASPMLWGAIVASQADGHDFDHYDHVAEAWMNPSLPEEPRDCQGCHDPSDPGAIESAQLCGACHVVNAANESLFAVKTRPGFDQRVDPGYKPLPGFTHGDHVILSCRECHAPETLIAQLSERPAEGTGGPFPSGPVPIRRGAAECARCHGSDGPEFRDTILRGAARERVQSPAYGPDRLARGLQQRLDASPEMGSNGFGPFLHRDHLRAPGRDLESLLSGIASEDGCAKCHSAALSSDSLSPGGAPEGRPAPFVGGACADCHRTADSALSFVERGEAPGSLTAGSFFHADHLRSPSSSKRASGIAADAAYERIELEHCAACHRYGADEAQLDFEFHREAASYDGCLECHEAPAWRTRSHGEWQDCAGCHTFAGPASDFAGERPSADVLRRRPRTFRIATQAHPLVSGESVDEACSECHRAPVRELPSRIQEKPFQHATHLPPDPEADDCADCHGARVDLATASADIGTVAGERALGTDDATIGLTYDPSACARCHLGSPPVPSFGEARRRSVTEFSHVAHLGKVHPDPAVGVVDCADCHTPIDGKELTSFRTTSCAECHDHADNAGITGNLGGTDATSCARCHRQGIPFLGDLPTGDRRWILGVAGVQNHPLDTDCADCHLETEPEVPMLSVGNVSVAKGWTGDVHRGWGKPLGACLRCHWSIGKSGSELEERPTLPKVRDERGADLVDFPGLEGAK